MVICSFDCLLTQFCWQEHTRKLFQWHHSKAFSVNSKFMVSGISGIVSLALLAVITDHSYVKNWIDYFYSLPLTRIWGNKFHVGDNSPTWDFPLETVPIEKNISSPPTTQSSAIENYPSIKEGGHKKKLGPGGIAFILGGGTLVVSCAALYFAIQINRYRAQKLQNLGCHSPMHSLTITTAKGELLTDFAFIL